MEVTGIISICLLIILLAIAVVAGTCYLKMFCCEPQYREKFLPSSTDQCISYSLINSPTDGDSNQIIIPPPVPVGFEVDGEQRSAPYPLTTSACPPKSPSVGFGYAMEELRTSESQYPAVSDRCPITSEGRYKVPCQTQDSF